MKALFQTSEAFPVRPARLLVPLLSLLILLPEMGFAVDYRSIVQQDAEQSVEVIGGYFTRPLKWNSGEWAAAGGVVGLSLLAMTMDRLVQERAVQFHDTFPDSPVFQFGRWAGHGSPTIYLAGGLYGIGLLANRGTIRTTGRLLMESFLTAGLTTYVLKTAVGRARPYTGEGAFSFRPPGWNVDHRAFPSGHSTMGWVMAGVLTAQTDSPVLDMLWYTGATVISLSRLYHNKHWFSDVLLGGIIGYTAARYSVRRDRECGCNDNGITPGIRQSDPPLISIGWTF